MVIPSLASSLIISRTSPTISGSRADVGSSKSITSGFIAIVLAMAIRCFCPPERLSGYASAFSRSPTLSSSSMALFLLSSALTPLRFIGASIIFWSTVLLGNRLNCWNTIPIFCLTLFILVFLSRISVPSNTISPASGLSSLFRERRKVDFPHPDGPTMAITSPFLIVVLIPSRTTWSP